MVNELPSLVSYSTWRGRMIERIGLEEVKRREAVADRVCNKLPDAIRKCIEYQWAELPEAKKRAAWALQIGPGGEKKAESFPIEKITQIPFDIEEQVQEEFSFYKMRVHQIIISFDKQSNVEKSERIDPLQWLDFVAKMIKKGAII